MAKKFKVSIIAVCTLVNQTNGDTNDSNEFCPKLTKQIKRVKGGNMVILLEDFTTQAGTNKDR